ncbi:MAG: hypothetical protein WCT04_03445 [Planctomycetota bacterium]
MPNRPAQGCTFHPPLSARANCKSCGAPLCSLCIKFVNGKVLCENCMSPSAVPGNPMSNTGRFAGPKIESASQSVRFQNTKPMPPEAYAQSTPAQMDRSMEQPVQGSMDELLRRRNDPMGSRSARVYFCKKHPSIPAEKKCDLCSSVFCVDCVQTSRKKQLCYDCANPNRSSVSRTRAPVEEKKSFFERLPEAFLYPLINDRKFLLVGGSLFVWLGFAAHWAVGVALCLLSAIWLMKIVRVSALGREDDPTHPAFDDAVHDIATPGFFCVLALVAALAPALVYIPLGNPDLRSLLIDKASTALSLSEAQPNPSAPASPSAAASKKPKTLNACVERDGTLQILIVIAALLFPMAFGMISIFPSIDAVSPPVLFGGVLKLAPYYIMILTILAFSVAPSWYILNGAESATGPSGLAVSFISHYFSIVAFSAFGNMYAADKVAFAWVALPTAGSK